jgi:hypothetical protein
MVVNNIVYSSRTSRIEWGNIVCSDGIRNIAFPLHPLGGVGWGVESRTLVLIVSQQSPDTLHFK